VINANFELSSSGSMSDTEEKAKNYVENNKHNPEESD